MRKPFRTDLAEEAVSARKAAFLDGVEVFEKKEKGFPLYDVRVKTFKASQALEKPTGRYLTFSLYDGYKSVKNGFSDAVSVLSEAIRAFLPKEGEILVAGLGNREVTSDAIGPETLRSIVVTRHLIRSLPDSFGSLRPVSALAPGVLGVTGIESGDILEGVFREISPKALVVIDALAAESASRLLTTVQITDTGLVPGSGVGNARAKLTPEALGVPVIAIGVPTVIYAETLLREAAGALSSPFGDLIVTPKEIDGAVKDVSKLIGYSLDLALFDGMTLSDAAHFLS